MIQIKHKISGEILFEANLGSLKVVVEAAISAEADLIDAGQDIRGYRFVAVKNGGDIFITAGCRWLCLDDAKNHWAESHNDRPELKAECLAKVSLIESVATARGWIESELEK